MKLNQMMLLLLVILLLIVRCDTTEPPPTSKASIALRLEDVSCTEAWLTLKTTDISLPTSVVLKQNDIARTTINLTTADTLLYIDSLLPKQAYTYQVSGIGNPVSSNALSVTTMDTTSHNFTWQTFTFGQHSNNVLYDVAIINGNNIWAVGEIYMNDSLGQPDPNFYNLIKWNGAGWKPERIYFVNSQGQSFLAPMKSIFAFNANDVWIGLDQIIHWNGSKYISIELSDAVFNGWINKLWGTSGNDLYAVGDNSNIAHYNGSSWIKIESGTMVNLADIYGTPDGKEVWVCGWNNSDGHTILLKIENNHSEIIYDSFNPNNNLPYNGFISSLWTNGKNFFWLTGTSKGIVKHSFSNKNSAKLERFAIQYFPYRLRGTELNDVSTSGDAAMIWHYNGYSWRMYEELLNLDDRVRSIDMRGRILAAIGIRYETILGKGLIILGMKQ